MEVIILNSFIELQFIYNAVLIVQFHSWRRTPHPGPQIGNIGRLNPSYSYFYTGFFKMTIYSKVWSRICIILLCTNQLLQHIQYNEMVAKLSFGGKSPSFTHQNLLLNFLIHQYVIPPGNTKDIIYKVNPTTLTNRAYTLPVDEKKKIAETVCTSCKRPITFASISQCF